MLLSRAYPTGLFQALESWGCDLLFTLLCALRIWNSTMSWSLQPRLPWFSNPQQAPPSVLVSLGSGITSTFQEPRFLESLRKVISTPDTGLSLTKLGQCPIKYPSKIYEWALYQPFLRSFPCYLCFYMPLFCL